MNRILAYLLTILVLLQTFSRELVVADYQLRKESITRLLCVNKDKPRLQCNGKCHLAKTLRAASANDRKAPASEFATIKYEAVLPLAYRLPASAHDYLRPLRYARLVSVRYRFAPDPGIFHPPAVNT
ncbi:hypothetical protein LGH70_09685 [Hymenobacter sp. BT635]|uniref:Uncharacterized protein n=1 Tax=Hymenobacter nitidus TaxID=2880929 RepID=A0ABS8ABV0_9BACT|nr:hypothetical protein [Hymenobacter nitidus]MCB2377852.1 hypothetical protein [Hymenobacter nitidus]